MSRYIGSNNVAIDISYTSLSRNNTWNYFTQFSQLSTSCIDISSSTTITNIPNNIIIFGGNLTITFPTTMPNAIILHIRRTISGTTTFSGPTFYATTNNAIMTSSTNISISFVSYNNGWYKLF